MRTTVSVDDHLLAEAKRRAQGRGVSLGRVIEDALRVFLQGSEEPSVAPEIPVFRGTGVRPGVDLRSNRALRALLDEDQPLHRLR